MLLNDISAKPRMTESLKIATTNEIGTVGIVYNILHTHTTLTEITFVSAIHW